MSYSQNDYFYYMYSIENKIFMIVMSIKNDSFSFIIIFFIIIIIIIPCLLQIVFIFNTVSCFFLNNTNLNDGNMKLKVRKI